MIEDHIQFYFHNSAKIELNNRFQDPNHLLNGNGNPFIS